MSLQYSRTFLAAALAGTSIAALAVPVGAAFAQSVPRANFNIPAQDAAAALEEFGRQSGRAVMFDPARLTGARSRAVRGAYAPEDALRRLLAGTGFTARAANANTFVVEGVATVPGEGEAGGAAADSGSAEDDASRILVVGSRLGVRSPAESAVPIRVITREEIDRSGAGSIAQALSYLPEVSVNNVGDSNIGAAGAVGGGSNAIDATTVQLRGLPAGTTLILINGRRAGESSAFQSSGQFDLSTIPLAMVERIEVLPAGASAIYGGDALAGVVNIVLRRGSSGVEVRARRSVTEGHQESEASILWGRSWSGAQVTVGANWRKTGRLTNFERAITADQDYRRFGGRDLRGSTGFPANVYSLAGCPPAPSLCFLPLEQRGNLPGLNAPFAMVPAGQNGLNLTPADFAATAGMVNRISSLNNLFSPSESWGANFSGSLDVTSDFELFAELAFNRRDIPAVVVPFALSGGNFGATQARIPANNPFNPFGVDVGVNFGFRETGLLQDFGQTYWRALIGARWQIGSWNLDVTATQSRDRNRFSPIGTIFNPAAIVTALQSSDPATALNPFVGDGSAPWSDQLLQSLLTTPRRTAAFASQLRDVTGFARGPLLRLPAGDVLLLVGGEYQRQSLSNNLEGFEGEGNTSKAAFGEIRVPILDGSNASYDRLTLTGAWRQEWSDRFEGSADTQTVGIEFRPWQTLMIRGTYSTAFKPVTLIAAIRGLGQFSDFLPDVRFDNEFFPVEVIVGGGVPDGLVPETGTSRTLGLVWSPAPNFRASATWWDSRLRNRFLQNPDPVFLIENENLFPGRVIRDPGTGLLVSVDSRVINIARTNVSGIDISVEGRWSTRFGDFIPTIAATYMIEHEEQILVTLPIQNNLGVRRDTGWSPRWKIVPRLGWDYRNIVHANFAGRYVSGYQDPLPLLSGPNAGQLQRLGDFWLIDLNVEVNLGRWLVADSRLLAGTRLSFGVTNLFDRLPDFCNSCGNGGYDPSQYDIVGRRFQAGLRFSF